MLERMGAKKIARSDAVIRVSPAIAAAGAAVVLPLSMSAQLRCARWQCNCLAVWFGSTTAEPVSILSELFVLPFARVFVYHLST